MLQIEILPNRATPFSQSVTSGTDFAELLLQIETFWDRGWAIAAKPPQRCLSPLWWFKGACPHCGGLGLPGAGGFDVDVLAGYGMRKGHTVGVEHQTAGARRAVQVVAN